MLIYGGMDERERGKINFFNENVIEIEFLKIIIKN